MMTAFSFLGELYLQNFYITIITKKKEEINTFIQHGRIQFIKRIKFIIKFIIHLKGYKLNAVILIFLFIKENQPIRMISERSCDTKDWSDDAENSALPSQE